MFDLHQATIGKFARQSPQNMRRVYLFVIATIQQSIETVPEILADIEANGIDSIHAWGFKGQAIEFINSNFEAVYSESMAIYDGHACPDHCAHELLKYFASLPGLGLAKGGFMAQLCFGLSGCIDSHNLARFNISESEFKSSRYKKAKSPELRASIVEAYNTTVNNCGGCRGLWDSWCEYVAGLRADLTGFDVSALHCKALGLPHD